MQINPMSLEEMISRRKSELAITEGYFECSVIQREIALLKELRECLY